MIFQSEKNALLGYKNKKFKKSKKLSFFSEGLIHGFRPELAIFPFLFKAIQAGKMCFMIFQKEKPVFQALKPRSSKSGKIEIFSKGLVHGFRPKLVIFPSIFLKAISARKMCCMISQKEKMVFQALKTRIVKSQKIEIFSKGLVHGVHPKLAIFPYFFFRQYRRGKCVL